MHPFTEFTGLYPLQKTLAFEARPIGKTLENILNSGVLDKDEHRAQSSKKVKKIIDEYHKSFIEESLKGFKLYFKNEDQKNSLEEYYSYYSRISRDADQKQIFEKIQANLRKQIAEALSKEDAFKRLDKQDLIKKDLWTIISSESDKELLKEFEKFTTYFTGFNQNRMNMYTDEPKSTAIPFRLINDNLPKFIDNIFVYEKVISTEVGGELESLNYQLKPFLKVESLDDLFKLEYFNSVLTQKQIELYNSVIGKIVKEDGTEIRGINEYINAYNQNQSDKKNRLPLLKPLFKQILSDRVAVSWLPESFKTGNEVLEAIKEYLLSKDGNIINLFNGDENVLRQLLLSLNEYNLDGIYIENDAQLTDISKRIFGSWNFIKEAQRSHLRNNNPRKKNEKIEAYEKRIDLYLKHSESLSLSDINSLVLSGGKSIVDYFTGLGAVNTQEKQTENLFAQITNAYTDARELFETDYPENQRLSQDEKAVEKIKNLLDAINNLKHFVKPLLGKGNESGKDERFYGEFLTLWADLDEITPLYNKVRNFMTQKPFSQEKIKLNFENPTLLGGWAIDKEWDNSCALLRKDELYYLAIFNRNAQKKNPFHNMSALQNSDETSYEKIEYHFFKDLTTMVPKCSTQLKEVRAHFEKNDSDYILTDRTKFVSPLIITKEIFDLNNICINGKKKFQIDYLRRTNDEAGYKYALRCWIKFCLEFLKSYKNTSIYDVDYLRNEDAINKFASVDEFYSEVNNILYKLTFTSVPTSFINNLVEEGKIFLFLIYNKDFSEHSKGTPSLHTLYWKMLFDETNLSNVNFKLNGGAEIFYRKRSILNTKPTHPAHKPIANKNIDNQKKESLFDYDLIKDRRYTVDKFHFHVPITLNFKCDGRININEKVNHFIKESDDLHIIGIDRGERHLLYLSVINKYGEIIEQYSLNDIVNEYNGNIYHTNYHDLLDKREVERASSRQSWKSIENIKELKEGYLSQVIHKIVGLIEKYNAIVVLEDLNIGFMRGRQKVEKQVYQKFEKMLIDKLNYLVDKKKCPTELGGLLNAYQLTGKFESFQKLGKQSGILFYIPAWNTSKIDPVTGFTSLFPSTELNYESVAKSKSFFSKFDVIRYNPAQDYFEFKIDYSKFDSTRGKAEGTREVWTLCSKGTRIETFRNVDKNSQWDNREIDLTKSLKDLFSEYGIDIYSNLKEAISKQDDKVFYFNDTKSPNAPKGLMQLFKLILQMRNTRIGTEEDYLISPVVDINGDFYDSRLCKDSLPENADANGAYNIARKGLWIIRQIKQTQDLKKIRLAISNKDWLQFAQEKPYLSE